jgi:hypothetical protein
MKGIWPAGTLIFLCENFPSEVGDYLWREGFCGEGACPRSAAQQSQNLLAGFI